MSNHNGDRTKFDRIAKNLAGMNQRTVCRATRNDSGLTEKVSLCVEVQNNNMLLLFVYANRTYLTDNILRRLDGSGKGTMRRANGATDERECRRKLYCRDFTDTRNVSSTYLLPARFNKIGRRPEMLDQTIGNVNRA